MGQLRYYKRAYFRSAETDVDSFRPYFHKIVWIILITFVAYGIQTVITKQINVSASQNIPIALICDESKPELCPPAQNMHLKNSQL